MRVIKVTYRHEDDGAWIGTSDQAPGFVGHGDSLSEARKRVQEGLPFFLDEPDLLIAHVALNQEEPSQSIGGQINFGITSGAPRAAYSAEFSQTRVPA